MPASPELAALEAQVTRVTAVVPSVVALLNGLSAKIIELKNDPVAL